MDRSQLHRLRQQDRIELVKLLGALNGAINSLRRDDCGDPTITGSRGHITACNGAFSIYVQCRSMRHWTYTKRRLVFCRVNQDGDDEGILQLDRLPSSKQAVAIRSCIGLRQTVQVSPEQADRLRENPHGKAR